MKTLAQKRADKAYYERHRDRLLEEKREYRATHKDAIKKSKERWYAEHPEYRKEYQLRYKYGMTPAEFSAMLSLQDGKCAVCGTTEWGTRGPVVDHDHKTGMVRGILCSRCNVAAGMIDDNPETATALAEYFRRETR